MKEVKSRSQEEFPNILNSFPPDKPPSRVVVDRIFPEIDGGRFPAKRFIDEAVEISATLLVDGHDHVKGRLLYRAKDEKDFKFVLMRDQTNDIFSAAFQPTSLGLHYVTVEAAVDRFDTWSSDVTKKLNAGQNIAVDLLSGALLLEDWLEHLLYPQ